MTDQEILIDLDTPYEQMVLYLLDLLSEYKSESKKAEPKIIGRRCADSLND